MALAATLCCGLLSVARPPSGPQKFARPPKWTPDVMNVFYPDARAKLVGARPDFQHIEVVATNSRDADKSASGQSKPGTGWSKLIDADTIESEIKRISPELAKATKSPSEFKSGGFKDCRRDFSVLAALFAVDAEYDGEVRWQDVAPGLRDAFARAGHNCKAASDQTFQEAAQRRQDLGDLIAGNRPKTTTAVRRADWSTVADRPPLMQRLNIAHQDRLTKWLATKTEFAAHRDDVKTEAQLAATIADIIGHEGYEYWDDESYAKFARSLRQAASDVAAAVDADNYEQAQQANNRMSKACIDCHEGFRG
ncbi:MAG TPA: hypothetical protein VHE81_10010 [Lacipirellulaceae bacterium]|nr:hypothetical protein [Lacipirellulaceae bacterium]